MNQSEITVPNNSNLYNYITENASSNDDNLVELYGSLFFVVGYNAKISTRTHADFLDFGKSHLEILKATETTFFLNYKGEASAEEI